ncbi:hypothetical protein DITRI_Ditri13aG0158600 [Diplodiscus trichospermus]
MLHIRFTGLLLVLLFVLHAPKICSVHAHQGEETVGGRKMGGHERKETDGKQGLEMLVEASKNSGAKRYDRKCDFQGKGDFNVKCKSGNEISGIPKVETADFVAFGADYHGPNRHPPRHN